MSPYRSHSPLNERRVRRLIRKQGRLDKRLLKRAEIRFRRDETIQNSKNLVLSLLLAAIMVYAMVMFLNSLSF